MDEDDFVPLKDLAERLGLHKINLRKWLKKQHPPLNLLKKRTADSGPNLVHGVTTGDADKIIQLRRQQGLLGEAKPTSEEKGYFYVIQLLPEFDANRVKLGFAINVADRLQQHRTSAPTATLRKMWPCRRTWENTAIAALTASGCRLIMNEVFECDDVDQLVTRGEAFFAMLPDPGSLTPLAACSPLNQAADNSAESGDEKFAEEDELEQEAAEQGAPADGGRDARLS